MEAGQRRDNGERSQTPEKIRGGAPSFGGAVREQRIDDDARERQLERDIDMRERQRERESDARERQRERDSYMLERQRERASDMLERQRERASDTRERIREREMDVRARQQEKEMREPPTAPKAEGLPMAESDSSLARFETPLTCWHFFACRARLGDYLKQ